MRTKTLLLTAALSVAAAATSMADVFSVNVVGYVNKTIPPGFSLIANPLNATNNTLGKLIPTAPDGTQFFKYNTGSGFTTYTYDDLEGAWLPNGDVTLAPGEGGFIRNFGSTDITVTFIGEVLQGSLTNNLPTGYSMRGSMVPQAQTLTEMGLPAQDGDQVYKYTTGSGYTTYTFDDLEGDWLPTSPTIGVGEAFFLRKAVGQNWVRTFTVN